MFRWLVSKGKFDKAIGILRKFEKINRTNVGEDIYKQFRVRTQIHNYYFCINKQFNYRLVA